MAAVALGLFVEVEATSFERHLGNVLPIIQLQTQPEKYDKVSFSTIFKYPLM